jgi:hypothetical protein
MTVYSSRLAAPTCPAHTRPGQTRDQGGVHRQAERVARLLARRFAAGHQPAVGGSLTPEPGDRADRERHGEVGGGGEQDGGPAGVAAVLHAEQQQDDGDHADEVGDDDQAHDRRHGAAAAGRPGREDAVPADRLGSAPRLHAQRNDDRRTAVTAAVRIGITGS